MLALKLGSGPFVFTGHARTVAAGNGRSTVRRATGYFVNPHLSLEGIGKADHHKSVVKQGDMKGRMVDSCPPC